MEGTGDLIDIEILAELKLPLKSIAKDSNF